ncbi:MAG: NAD(P)/FAD-dependent oxidoreductase [Candidatus Hodarchaeales archaeon]|jgi:geranylgeranyl reductase family protein
MTTRYDAIIVGAQTGGSAAGIALAKKGLKVALLDSKKYEKIGEKVCGDATSPHYFERIKNEFGIPIDPPSGAEIRQAVEGFYFISPDRKTKLQLDLSGGYIIDRFAFVRRIFKSAEDMGCDILHSTRVRKPIVEDNAVTGVEVRQDNNITELHAKVIVDASGINAAIRRELDPAKTFMDPTIQGQDMCYCYREVRDLKHEIEEPGVMRLFFDQELCPGGYYWAFPAGSTKVNAGLGVEVTGSQPSAKKQFVEHVLKGDKEFSGVDFRESTLIHGGGARVPLRRPIDTLVWNGLCLVGDAGSIVKPTDGGGIGLSVISAAMVSQPIADALEEDDFSRTGPLWNYNASLMRTVGAVNAPLAILKLIVTQTTNKDINEVFGKRILTADDLASVNAGEGLSISYFDKLKRVVRGRKILRLILKLRSALKDYRKAEKLYQNYPEEFGGFIDWRKKILKLYS